MGDAHGAPCAVLPGRRQCRWVVGISPSVVYLLIGAITTYVGKETVEVLLQLSVA